MNETFVPLTRSTELLQRTLIEDVLHAEKIPFTCVAHSMETILGVNPLVGFHEFRVRPDDVTKAKETLCANGIVCDVSERLLRRVLDEVVQPLLAARPPERDYARLIYLVQVNNKETVRAIFETTVGFTGGPGLLEDFFFALAREASPRLRLLARALSASATHEFYGRYISAATSDSPVCRGALLDVLHEFPSPELHQELLQNALVDADLEIREAASEALFNLKGSSCGYDPTADADERLAVVRRILGRKVNAI
jgi:hypothetical protein